MLDQQTVRSAVVAMGGDLDIATATAPTPRRELTTALNAHREVVLDQSGVDFMDCAGLGALVHAHNLAGRLGARLVLRGAGRPVLRLLKLTGLDRRLRAEPGPGAPAGAPRAKGETR
ncbi:STAS domain-containing protein [Streptomyces sp. M-16]|uniref:STAS domain-containing protein n=1 Tax=Streptomyces sp. M-16 TaxID=3233040 RepID=UPI003F9692F9